MQGESARTTANLVNDIQAIRDRQTANSISEFVIKKDNLFTNVLNVFFDESIGNVYPLTNISVLIQALLILNIFKSLKKVKNKTIYFLQFIILLSYFFENGMEGNFLASNYITLNLSHTIIITLGWVILYNSYKNTSDFAFYLLSTLVIYNTVFLILVIFQDKIDSSKQLFDYLFILRCLLYIGANISYSRALWLVKKN
jgi:hypothetical protein